MYLIIGANGFIGNKAYWALKAAGMAVKGTYFPDPHNLDEPDAIYLNLEQTDFKAIKELEGVKGVILCHGISGLDQCKQQPERTRQINVENTGRLLHCFNPQLVKVVFLSTSLIYAGDKNGPTEQDEPHPCTEYGRQKVAVEKFIISHFRRALILRLTKVFGVEKGDHTLFTSWLDRMIAGQKIKTATDSYISPVFVNDLVRQLVALLERDLSGVFNLGGQQVNTLAAFGRQLAGRFGFADRIEEVKTSELGLIENRPKFNSVDSGKLWRTISPDLTPMETCFGLLENNYGIKVAKI